MKKIVKGNDFTLKIPVMKMVEGQAKAFPLPACTDVVVQVCNQFKRIPLAFEIDVKEDNLTGAQRQYLMQNQEYVNSLQYVSKLVQDEELRIIRPRIESTQQGQEALKKHLSLMQRLRKEVAQAEEQKSAMLNDYMTNHSDKTWQEYLVWYNKTKKGGVKK